MYTREAGEKEVTHNVLPMRGYQCLSFWIKVQHTYWISPELLMKPKFTVFVLTINVTCPIVFISLAICTLSLKFLCLLDSLALQECYDKAVAAHDSWECAYITLEASGCLLGSLFYIWFSLVGLGQLFHNLNAHLHEDIPVLFFILFNEVKGH